MKFENRKKLRIRSLAGATVLAAMSALGGCVASNHELRNEGLRLYHRGNYHAALQKFDEALSRNQSEPRANYYAGAADYMLGRYERAAYHYKLAWRVDPNLPHVKSALAEALIRQGKHNEAMNFLGRDASLTGRVSGRLRVARFYEKLGDWDDAKTNFALAAKIGAQDPAVLIEVGKFYDRIGEKSNAVAVYEQAYRVAPNTPGLVTLLENDGVSISDALMAPNPAAVAVPTTKPAGKPSAPANPTLMPH